MERAIICLHVIPLAWDVHFVVVVEGWKGGAAGEQYAALCVFHCVFEGTF